MSCKLRKSMEKFDSWIERVGLDKKEYQHEGVKWMIEKEQCETPITGTNGGIIADEMGLGKTIQMLGLIYSNFVERTLIIVPLTLLTQWENEILRLFGHKVCIYYGVKKDSKENIERMSNNAPIVLTTYGSLVGRKKDGEKEKEEKKESNLHNIYWNRIIFDEGHKLRNKNNKVTLNALKLKGKCKWIVTGTPIQNKKSDFYTLCDIIGLPKEFYSDEKNLLSLSKNFILYRKKKDVGIELPDLRIHDINVEWENKEEKILAENLHSNLTFANVNVDVKNVNRIVSMMNNKSILASMIRAKQSCILPSLMSKKIDEVICEIEKKQEERSGNNEITRKEKENLYNFMSSSSKLNAVIKTILERKENKRRKIIFCHFKREIDILEERLSSKGLKCNHIDGRISNIKRREILEDEKIDVLILQINSCSDGLNLQQYSEVYFVSPHWNPCVEDQAIARTHRIGQNQDVDIFRYCMSSFNNNNDDNDENETMNIEEYCRLIQENKRKLSNNLLENTCKKINYKKLSGRHECNICYDYIQCCSCNTNISKNEIEVEEEEEEEFIELSCKHVYHKKCIDNWIYSNNKNACKCPLCRKKILD